MEKLTLLVAVFVATTLLSSCASTPVIVCPDDPSEGYPGQPQSPFRVQRLPDCTDNLDGCWALDGSETGYICERGEWRPVPL